MRPDRTNYETWLIDYLDGNLDEIRVNRLMEFLEENPDIKEEFADILTYNLRPSSGSYRQKDLLKKTAEDLSDAQFEYLCISAAENDLSQLQEEEMDAIVSRDPQRKRTWQIYKRLKLVPPAIVYNKKSSLRRLTLTQKIVRLSVLGLSAAAGIALMVTLFNFPGKNTGDFNSITSSIPAGDSNRPEKTAVVNPGNINPVDKTPEKKTIAGNLLSHIGKIVSDEMKTFPAIPSSGDSSALRAETLHANITKIDFRKEVVLGEKEFTSTLVAINTDNSSIEESTGNSGINGFIIRTFREKILKSKTRETGSLKAYEIADAGINGLNKLLGWQMSLQKTRDEKGDLKSLYFSSKMLKFNAPVKKVQLEP